MTARININVTYACKGQFLLNLFVQLLYREKSNNLVLSGRDLERIRSLSGLDDQKRSDFF